MGYLRPVDAPISCTWQCHKDRPTPSSMPGTDYACAYGTPVLSGDNGTVTFVNHKNTGASGRGVDVRFDDGRTAAYIHLSADIRVKVGQRVSRGQAVALSGASGYGKDWYYGPHVHVTLWSGVPWQSANIDFENYVGAGGALEPTQRRASTVVNRRELPTSKSTDLGNPLQPGAIGNFIGWVTGETVNGNSVWFKGTSNAYFWSGGFEGGPDTSALPDLNALAPNQRRATNVVNGRTAPSTSAPIAQTLEVGAVGTFDGWIHGERVDSEDRWIRGALSGNWFWLTPFHPTDVSGLTDLNPVPPQPGNTRTVAVNPASIRTGPWTALAKLGEEPGGTVVAVDAWARGEKVNDIDVWFRRTDANWMWAGGFTSQSTDGLVQIADPPTPIPGYEFEVDFDFVTGKAAAMGNFEFGRFPTLPNGIVLHQFGTFGRDTFKGTIAWFQNPASYTSAHFVVSGENIVQMVSLVDRAYHAGPTGNDNIGIEIDPVVGQPDGTPGKAETIASVKKLLAAIEGKYGYMPSWHRHSEFMATACGEAIHFEDFKETPPPAPTVTVTVEDAKRWESMSRQVADEIKKYLG